MLSGIDSQSSGSQGTVLLWGMVSIFNDWLCLSWYRYHADTAGGLTQKLELLNTSRSVTKTLVSKSCLVATHVSDSQQHKPACEAAPTISLGCDWFAHAVSQPVPGSRQPCSQRAPAHTNMKGFPGCLYLTKFLWTGEDTFVHLLPADRRVALSLACRMSVSASHPFYLSFPWQTALAEGVEAG